MKSFNQFMTESTITRAGNHHWVDPHHTDEHDEVHTQHKDLANDPHTPDHVKHMLNHLRKKENYHAAMKSGTTTTIHHNDKDLHNMGNTDAADPNGMKSVEKEKRKRVEGQFQQSHKAPIKKPIIMHDTHTGHRHLLGGNTRLTHGIQGARTKVPVHTISYNSSKLPAKGKAEEKK